MPSWPLPTEMPGAAGLRAMVADDLGSGPPVVLLHGQPGGRHDWDPVVARLGGRLRLLVPDRPGYGRTGGVAGGFAANADAVAALLDRHGVERATVVGYSWAGAVALEVAHRHPARVTALVLVASVGGAGSIDDLDRLLGIPVLGPALALGGLAVVAAARLRRLWTPGPAPGGPVRDAPRDRWLAPWRSFVAEERAMLDELGAVTARLPSIEAATIVVVGGADRVVRPRAQEALAAELPRAEVVRVPGRGHLLPRDASHVVADAILRVARGDMIES